MNRKRLFRERAWRSRQRQAAPFGCHLVIMAKLPIAGRVKTRLAREVGTVEATRFYRVTGRLLLMRLARQPFWTTHLAVSPDTGITSPVWPRHVRRIPQGGGDLGVRMHQPMRTLPPGPVCVVGTDIPAIRVADVRRAFRALGRCDAVFGPADDGGFWLVGMRRRPRLVFPYDGVRWSRSDTLAAVETNLSDVRFERTSRLSDVDNRADLVRCGSAIGRLIQSD